MGKRCRFATSTYAREMTVRAKGYIIPRFTLYKAYDSTVKKEKIKITFPSHIVSCTRSSKV